MKRKIRIFYISDNPVNKKLVIETLVKDDDELEVVVTETVTKPANLPEIIAFDLVLVDFYIPGLDCSQIVDRIKENDNSLPIIIVAEIESEKDAIEALKHGATDYVVKISKCIPHLRLTINSTLKNVKLLEDFKFKDKELCTDEIMFKILTDSAPVGIFSTDKNGLTKYVNPVWCEISQLSYNEALGNGWFHAVHPDDRAELEKVWLEASINKSLSTADYRFLHPNGSVTWVSGQAVPIKDPNGIISGYIGTITDITSRKLAEEQLAFNHAILKTQQEVSIDGILVIDGNDNIVSFNKHFIEMWNLPSDLLEKGSDEPVLKYITTQISDPDRFIERVRYLYNHQNETSHEELFLKDGRIFDRYSSPMIGNFNQHYGRVWFFLDITDSKKSEQEIISAREKAEESDKLKTSFLSNLSHEIRTPLNAILGFSELLQDTQSSQEDIKFYLEQMNYGKDDLLDLIENVVFAAKIETKQYRSIKKEFNLNDRINNLVSDSKKLLQRTNKSHIEIITHLGSTEAMMIEADENNLIIAIKQLLSNAIKFTDSGQIEIKTRLMNNKIEFSIKDTGIGIDKKEHERIFERFYKIESDSNRLYRGAGIGLTVAKGISETLGGNVRLNSKIDKGSTFYFTIPVNILGFEDRKSKPSNDISIKISKWKNCNILIAEDDDSNFEYLNRALNFGNINKFHARNGKEAIEIMNTIKIDLILMDILMPIMDGYEAASSIRTSFPSIPIIAQTAIFQKSDKDVDFANIFNDYLVKPVNRNSLVEIIDKYLQA